MEAGQTLQSEIRQWLRHPIAAWRKITATVEHRDIIEQVDNDGATSASYLFMTVVSAGIAMTGLLLNSPAVIIGAMLVSPLMGPISRFGLGVAMISWRRTGRAIISLLLGMLLSIAVAGLIVLLSPISDITPEILARTRPNLFDLLVAILSGLAGGYAMIRGRGGAIVGVAIATALMPPMTVVGYGLATQQWSIAQGALLLFTTNIVAIGLSVASIALAYGFNRFRTARALVWHIVLATVLLTPLVVPLAAALSDIASEARIARVTRAAIKEVLATADVRVLSLVVRPANGEQSKVDATVALTHFDGQAPEKIIQRVNEELGNVIELRLTPVLMSDPSESLRSMSVLGNSAQTAIMVPLQATAAKFERTPEAQQIVERFPFALQSSSIDEVQKKIVLMPQADALAELATLRQLETKLSGESDGWQVQIIPALRVLPLLEFGNAQAELDDAAIQLLDGSVWALSRWRIGKVEVHGFASSDGNGPAQLAQQRADHVAKLLHDRGVQSKALGTYPIADQVAMEIAQGRNAFRAASIVLPMQTPANQ